MFKKQIEVENEIVRSLEEALKDLPNLAVREVLRGISLDSIKHAEMYNSAISILTSVPEPLSEEQLRRLRALVEKHIRIEAELISKINEILPDVENEKVKLILAAILEDEKRHHELLRRVHEIIVRRETITEDEWWKFVWKDVPFYGTPGG
ncbi:MAG: ferritin-like domain-containing protein [Nitrososphaeria archaeon]|nr:ferritin-like domain-containing protein [Aigarchaeota archaeon]MCX8187804.1 ferritin-like domain-containing protein [Nitrososphaeria archaeon]